MAKFLCVCEGGNVRSAALAYLLHDVHGQEAICVGWRRVSQETLDYFCEWADRIVCMQTAFGDRIAERYHDKLRVVDVGPDRWGVYHHPELIEFFEKVTADWAGRNWDV